MKAIAIDAMKGFDVMREAKVVKHFDTYAEAWAYAKAHHLTVRYWALSSKEQPQS